MIPLRSSERVRTFPVVTLILIAIGLAFIIAGKIRNRRAAPIHSAPR